MCSKKDKYGFKGTRVKISTIYVSMLSWVLISKFRVKSVVLRIYHECEDGIEKSVPRITVWHYLACRVMTNSDHEGRIYLF